MGLDRGAVDAQEPAEEGVASRRLVVGAAETDGLRAAYGVPDDLTNETEVQVKPPEATIRDRPGVRAHPWSNRPSPSSVLNETIEKPS